MKLTQAIISKESGGIARSGASGETKSLAQWLPQTWEQRSKEVLGYVAPITPINERYVLSRTIQRYLDKGYTPYEYALIHNGGSTKEKKGINKYKIAYNTKAYAEDIINNIK